MMPYSRNFDRASTSRIALSSLALTPPEHSARVVSEGPSASRAVCLALAFPLVLALPLAAAGRRPLAAAPATSYVSACSPCPCRSRTTCHGVTALDYDSVGADEKGVWR